MDRCRSEEAIQGAVRLVMPELNGMIWRNNSGAATDVQGRLIRYGLANDSQKMNRQIKSSDLIGMIPMVVQPHHVGRTLGVFVAVECKEETWKWRGTAREAAQNRFLQLVNTHGGLAFFATDEAQVYSAFSAFAAITGER